MSGTSSTAGCPICGSEMDAYSDWKPFDTVYGECMYCGFSYYTAVGQLDLETVNRRRKEYNEESKPEEPLEPLTQKDLDVYAGDIKAI